jgi:hypothetical protein
VGFLVESRVKVTPILDGFGQEISFITSNQFSHSSTTDDEIPASDPTSITVTAMAGHRGIPPLTLWETIKISPLLIVLRQLLPQAFLITLPTSHD